MIFALPFGLGCALCQYVLPEPWRYWTAGIAVLALLLSSLLRGRQRSVVRIARADWRRESSGFPASPPSVWIRPRP